MYTKIVLVGRGNFEKRRVLATMRLLKKYKTISIVCLLIIVYVWVKDLFPTYMFS